MNAEIIWLCAGIALILLDVLGAPGAGFLFAGLGAILVGGLINGGLLDAASLTPQCIVFALASAGFAALLWKPLQRFRLGKNGGGYNNIIGETAYVSSAVLTKKEGEVSWSGTLMRAVLAADAAIESIESGKQVEITAISGVTLTVKPKA